MTKCANNQCKKHTLPAHNPTCIMSGKNRCLDVVHTKTCWTEQDLNILNIWLDNKIKDLDEKITA